jgi:hypothetical protein
MRVDESRDEDGACRIDHDGTVRQHLSGVCRDRKAALGNLGDAVTGDENIAGDLATARHGHDLGSTQQNAAVASGSGQDAVEHRVGFIAHCWSSFDADRAPELEDPRSLAG